MQVIGLNAEDAPSVVERGTRIAWAVVVPVVRARWEEVEVLGETGRSGARGAGIGRIYTVHALFVVVIVWSGFGPFSIRQPFGIARRSAGDRFWPGAEGQLR